MMRLYVFKDEVGMAVIAARNPEQARQMATWDWGKLEPIHVGDAHSSIQAGPELIEEVVIDRRSKKRWAGKSLLEQIWDELDTTYDRIMGMQDANDREAKRNVQRVTGGRKERPLPSNPLDILTAQSYAQGLAFAIMIIQNPYAPSMDAVREQAYDRWEERQ